MKENKLTGEAVAWTYQWNNGVLKGGGLVASPQINFQEAQSALSKNTASDPICLPVVNSRILTNIIFISYRSQRNFHVNITHVSFA